MGIRGSRSIRISRRKTGSVPTGETKTPTVKFSWRGQLATVEQFPVEYSKVISITDSDGVELSKQMVYNDIPAVLTPVPDWLYGELRDFVRDNAVPETRLEKFDLDDGDPLPRAFFSLAMEYDGDPTHRIFFTITDIAEGRSNPAEAHYINLSLRHESEGTVYGPIFNASVYEDSSRPAQILMEFYDSDIGDTLEAYEESGEELANRFIEFLRINHGKKLPPMPYRDDIMRSWQEHYWS